MRKMSKSKDSRIPTLESAIISYIVAQGNEESIAGNLKLLRRYLMLKGISDMPTENLSKLVTSEVNRLESVERDDGLLAELFTRDGTAWTAKYRHGSAFCGSCGLFKNYMKECPLCGKLEITL